MLHSALANYLGGRTTLTSTLPQQPSLGNSRAASIFVRYVHQAAVAPFILIDPRTVDENGNTSTGVLTRKGGFFTISVCGLVSSAQLDPINKALIAELEPLRQLWLPNANDANKVWCQYINVVKNFFHDGTNVQGNEEGLPSWKLICNTAFTEP